MNLSFYESLSQNQKIYANKIAERAKAMGIPPELAVSIAYQESKLNPSVQPGSFGEIGIMQIKPGTAKEMGFSVDDIKDPDKNIDAGLAYLKKSYDLSQGNSRLAAAGYNAGVNHPFFTPQGDKLPDITVKYLTDLKSYGAFAAPPVEAPAPKTETRAPQDVAESQSRAIGSIVGGTIGGGIAAKRAAMDLAKGIGTKVAEPVAEAIQKRMAPSAPPVGGGMAAGLADEATQLNRILQGTTDVDTGTTGRARMGGFNIETAQQAARAKQAAQNVGALRQAGLVAQEAPDVLAKAPGMTASPSGVLYPRAPAGPSAPPPTPSRGALEEVKQIFTRMMGPGTAGRAAVSAGLRYVAPPLAGMQAGSELASMMKESESQEPDYTKMGLSGLGALGAVMSMFPATAPVGIPLAVSAPMIQAGRERRGPLGQMGETPAP